MHWNGLGLVRKLLLIFKFKFWLKSAHKNPHTEGWRRNGERYFNTKESGETKQHAITGRSGWSNWCKFGEKKKTAKEKQKVTDEFWGSFQHIHWTINILCGSSEAITEELTSTPLSLTMTMRDCSPLWTVLGLFATKMLQRASCQLHQILWVKTLPHP